VTRESYCRDIEAYLCRKNDGHVIRVTGPAFERVSQWADAGIPLKVVCAGIDRYFERYYRRGPRRRPVRIEFCEADVLDAFDDWRRAVGVAQPADETSREPSRARVSLAGHIERTIAHLTALRASSERTRMLDAELERIGRALDRLQPIARHARGPSRDDVLVTLVDLDRELMSAVMAAVNPDVVTTARDEARAELAPFRARMAPDAYDRACTAAIERHVRAHFGLPTVSFP
jgi:hypothetical protein